MVIDSLQQQLVLDSTPNFHLRRQLMSESHQVELKTVQKMFDDGKISQDELTY